MCKFWKVLGRPMCFWLTLTLRRSKSVSKKSSDHIRCFCNCTHYIVKSMSVEFCEKQSKFSVDNLHFCTGGHRVRTRRLIFTPSFFTGVVYTSYVNLCDERNFRNRTFLDFFSPVWKLFAGSQRWPSRKFQKWICDGEIGRRWYL